MSIARPLVHSLFGFSVAICLGIANIAGAAIAQEGSGNAIDPTGTWRWEYDLEGTQYKDLVRLEL